MRSRATLALAGLLALLQPRSAFGQVACTEPGKARWALKSSVPSGYEKAAAKPVALGDLISLVDAQGVTKDDSRFRTLRIPTATASGLKEGDKISTAGYFRLVATEGNDCEYHMQVSVGPADSAVMIVEVAKDDDASIADPALRALAGQVRAFVRTKLVAGNEPSGTGNIMQHDVYVRMTGQLFFDDFHIGSPPRGKKGMKSPTLWELHPVTQIAIVPSP